jgi:hypothetical protein
MIRPQKGQLGGRVVVFPINLLSNIVGYISFNIGCGNAKLLESGSNSNPTISRPVRLDLNSRTQFL